LAFNKSEHRDGLIVSDRIRWLAIVTGLFTAVAGTFAGGLFFLMPIPLIIGAVVQPRFPRAGRGLICAGALWLTFLVFGFGILFVLERRSTDRLGMFDLITVVLVLLVAFCDLAIVIEEVKMRRT
jgi:hypothetical protein